MFACRTVMLQRLVCRFESLGKPVVLRANLDNLFDEDYWGTSTAGYLYLGAGRTLQLSASVDL